MPRLFDQPRLRYTYTVLMGFTMSTIVNFGVGFLHLGLSWQTFRFCLVAWPFAVGLNLVFSLLLSPHIRRLTLRLWRMHDAS